MPTPKLTKLIEFINKMGWYESCHRNVIFVLIVTIHSNEILAIILLKNQSLWAPLSYKIVRCKMCKDIKHLCNIRLFEKMKQFISKHVIPLFYYEITWDDNVTISG